MWRELDFGSIYIAWIPRLGSVGIFEELKVTKGEKKKYRIIIYSDYATFLYSSTLKEPKKNLLLN